MTIPAYVCLLISHGWAEHGKSEAWGRPDRWSKGNRFVTVRRDTLIFYTVENGRSCGFERFEGHEVEAIREYLEK
jgi:hypothetical protein